MRLAHLAVFSILFLFLGEVSANAEDGKEPRFMPSPGPYGVGFTTTSLYDDSRPPAFKIDHAVQSTGRRIQLLEWYPAYTGGKEMSILDYLRIADSPPEADWHRRDLPEEISKGFASSKLPMLVKFQQRYVMSHRAIWCFSTSMPGVGIGPKFPNRSCASDPIGPCRVLRALATHPNDCRWALSSSSAINPQI